MKRYPSSSVLKVRASCFAPQAWQSGNSGKPLIPQHTEHPVGRVRASHSWAGAGAQETWKWRPVTSVKRFSRSRSMCWRTSLRYLCCCRASPCGAGAAGAGKPAVDIFARRAATPVPELVRRDDFCRFMTQCSYTTFTRQVERLRVSSDLIPHCKHRNCIIRMAARPPG